MTEDQQADLVAALRSNPAFAEAFTKATTAEEAAAVAAEHGLNLTADQITAALGQAELSDAELANTTGGTWWGGATLPKYCDNPATDAWCTAYC